MSKLKIFSAILTGSRAYGTPHTNSDVDIVIRIDYATLAMLKREFPECNRAKAGYEDADTVIFEFGKLNLICCVDDDAYANWIIGTSMLHKEAPVTKERAVEVLETVRHGEDYANRKAHGADAFGTEVVKVKGSTVPHQHFCGGCGKQYDCTRAQHIGQPECPDCEIPF